MYIRRSNLRLSRFGGRKTGLIRLKAILKHNLGFILKYMCLPVRHTLILDGVVPISTGVAEGCTISFQANMHGPSGVSVQVI